MEKKSYETHHKLSLENCIKFKPKINEGYNKRIENRQLKTNDESIDFKCGYNRPQSEINELFPEDLLINKKNQRKQSSTESTAFSSNTTTAYSESVVSKDNLVSNSFIYPANSNSEVWSCKSTFSLRQNFQFSGKEPYNFPSRRLNFSPIQNYLKPNEDYIKSSVAGSFDYKNSRNFIEKSTFFSLKNNSEFIEIEDVLMQRKSLSDFSKSSSSENYEGNNERISGYDKNYGNKGNMRYKEQCLNSENKLNLSDFGSGCYFVYDNCK